ncbi:MAG: glycine--tRNA ligase subunit beta [Sedimentitalea sp.]
MPDLLIELFSEEIPARMQENAAAELQKRMTNGLVEAGLTYGGAAAFSTPRRLTLAVDGLLAASPKQLEERKGPRVDAPDKAVEGFLRSTGLAREDLEMRDTPKGAVFFAKFEKPGRDAADIVAEVLQAVIRSFPWPKSMRWGTGSLRWVRPLHSILCLLSDETGARIVPFELDGIATSDKTQGHRFMAPSQFSVANFDDYEAKLKQAFVVLSPQERADHIWADATTQAFAAGLEVVEDPGLLRELSGLVEWPVVLMGEIGPDFMDLPVEVLQTSMREHQKFLSVRNPNSGQIERFITVANRDTVDQGATILSGNQKVLAARLADAKFFWENDLRTTQTDINVWQQALENVTFHSKLGNEAERIDRMAELARRLAPVTGADPDTTETAARLAKVDLTSEMVFEFPELQGLMGRYYLERAGYSAEVANAAPDHYAPLGPTDQVPTAPVSVAVALGEKLDKLTGFWAINEKPTGSKDPFALRRAALGVIRLILENDLRLALRPVIIGEFFPHVLRRDAAKSAEASSLRASYARVFSVDEASLRMLEEQSSAIPDEERIQQATDSILDPITGDAAQIDSLLTFFHDRLKVYLRDQGLRHDIIDACIAMDGNDDLTQLVARAQALNDVVATEDGENLIQGFKRANNILTQAEQKDGVEYSYGADVKFAQADSEKALFDALEQAKLQITPALEAQDFPAAMAALADLRAPIDAFFEEVQINDDNATVRRNRLNLLSQIRQVGAGVADLTQIDG